jgi:hypothetical protein
VPVAWVPHILVRLRFSRLLGLAIDWTMFVTTLPSGERMRYQVLRIAVPRKGERCRSCSWPTTGTACRLARARTSWSRMRCWRSSRRWLQAVGRSSWPTAASTEPTS